MRKGVEFKQNQLSPFSQFSLGVVERLNPNGQREKPKRIMLAKSPALFLTTPTLRLKVVRNSAGLRSVEDMKVKNVDNGKGNKEVQK